MYSIYICVCVCIQQCFPVPISCTSLILIISRPRALSFHYNHPAKSSNARTSKCLNDCLPLFGTLALACCLLAGYPKRWSHR